MGKFLLSLFLLPGLTQVEVAHKNLQAVLAVDVNSNPQECSQMTFVHFIQHFDRLIYGGLLEPSVENLRDRSRRGVTQNRNCDGRKVAHIDPKSQNSRHVESIK